MLGPSMMGLVPLALDVSSALAQPSSGLVTLLPVGSNLIRRHEGTVSLHGSFDKEGQGTKRTQGHQPLSSLGRGS